VVHFLARVGVPHRRRQPLAKCFGFDTAIRQAVDWSATSVCPTSAPSSRGRHGTLKTAVHHGEVAIATPIGICAIVVGNLTSDGFQHFEC